MGSKEILVGGAGPAGLTAAVLLGREVYKVVVREKERGYMHVFRLGDIWFEFS